MSAPFASLVPALLGVSACTMVLVGTAPAGQVPGAVHMAVMRYAVAETPLVGVRGDFGTRWANRPVLDSSGVWVAEGLTGKRTAMRASAVVSMIKPIPWHDVSLVETNRPSSAGKGVVLGALVGTVVGGAVALSTVPIFSPDPDKTRRANRILLLSIGAGAALGALMSDHGERRAIYPAMPTMQEAE